MLTNVTLAFNVATGSAADNLRVQGGAATVEFANTILADDPNDPLQDGNCSSTGALTTLGNNLSTDMSCALNTGLGDIEAGAANLDLDPILADNGGPFGTLTHAIVPDPISFAVDTGSNLLCATDSMGVAVDQRGFLRDDGACDMGAFELGGTMTADADMDGFPDAIDNCPFTANPDQSDDGGLCLAGEGADVYDLAFAEQIPDLLLQGVSWLLLPGVAEAAVGIGDGIGNACQCGDADDDGLVQGLDRDAIRNALADPVGMALTAPGVAKCNVSGAPRPCDLRDVVVLARVVGGLASPVILPSCSAANP